MKYNIYVAMVHDRNERLKLQRESIRQLINVLTYSVHGESSFFVRWNSSVGPFCVTLLLLLHLFVRFFSFDFSFYFSYSSSRPLFFFSSVSFVFFFFFSLSLSLEEKDTVIAVKLTVILPSGIYARRCDSGDSHTYN